jgi:uncharacterized surface protein with fasciclin (FAS1) repeats
MKRTTLRRTGASVATLAALSIGLTACSSEDDSSAEETSQEEAPATAEETEEEAAGAGAQVFGPACEAVPTNGQGSFDGMVDDPVATAASNNPLLGTLVTAVTQAELVDTLNDADALTVFAPTDDAFGAIPEADLQAVLADQELLTSILTYHVVGGQLDPEAVVGEQETLQGGTVNVEGDTDGMTVNGAAVLCGNIPTANATVYVIDTVLMPS